MASRRRPIRFTSPWFTSILPLIMRLSSPSLLGLAAQAPLQHTLNSSSMAPPDFAFKEGPDIFSPRDLVQLPRPAAGVANAAGDLVFVPVSQYSLKDNK